jgi:hypothetical protein
MRLIRLQLALLTLLLAVCQWTALADRVTTPKQHFGFDIGQDYQLANYQQLLAYYDKLAMETKRIRIEEIGKSEEGRPMKMAIISSPKNQGRLARLKETSKRLALAQGVDEKEAAKLAKDGCAVVWIDGGLHANETLGAQQLIETVYRLCSQDDEETKRILDNVVVLCVLVNPDGMDLVSDWYMRNSDPLKRSLAGIPRLYQKYIGHDDNRDFYAVTQSETKAVNRILYREWMPQILYNHHQTGPAGAVMFAPPFRDPFNYNVDPLVINGIDRVGSAMMQRFLAESKGGVTVRSGATYSTWWNGGLRTTAYFHNIIGLLTETIGNPTPTRVPFVASKQQPGADLLLPVEPGEWHMRQSIEYSITANWAVMEYAAKHREDLLRNMYLMGKRAIEAGGKDTWTFSPTRMGERAALAGGRRGGAGGAGQSDFRKPEDRNPRVYIIPADQADFPTATKFVNTLIENGITIHRAKAEFEADDKRYRAGSYVIQCAQAFRSHILDMFEPQDHPNDFAYPGGPPVPPYDIAGWTLAFQMGVRFDRLFESVNAPLEEIKEVVTGPYPVAAHGSTERGWKLDAQQNDAFKVVNRLLAIGAKVSRFIKPFTNTFIPVAVGDFYIEASGNAAAELDAVRRETGVRADTVPTPPAEVLSSLQPIRIGLWDTYGGSMPSGWTRWILERYEFPFKVVFPPELDAGGLRDKFDVLIFPAGAISLGAGPASGLRTGDEPPEAPGGSARTQRDESDIPAEYRGRRGRISAETTLPKLREFLEQGGTVLCIGGSTSLARAFGLPVTSHLVDSDNKPLVRDKFYVPGSILRAKLDTTNPLTWGITEDIDMFFQQSPVFKVGEGVKNVGWFDTDKPLRSGWAWGQAALKDGVAVADAKVGKGHLVLYGPEVLFRAQPHGTFKLVFNGIWRGVAGD